MIETKKKRFIQKSEFFGFSSEKKKMYRTKKVFNVNKQKQVTNVPL